MAAGLPSRDPEPRKRSACDFCHRSKVKCSGDTTCSRCRDNDLPCTYSYASRTGKPKGSKNKKTLEMHSQLREEARAARCGQSPASDAGLRGNGDEASFGMLSAEMLLSDNSFDPQLGLDRVESNDQTPSAFSFDQTDFNRPGTGTLTNSSGSDQWTDHFMATYTMQDDGYSEPSKASPRISSPFSNTLLACESNGSMNAPYVGSNSTSNATKDLFCGIGQIHSEHPNQPASSRFAASPFCNCLYEHLKHLATLMCGEMAVSPNQPDQDLEAAKKALCDMQKYLQCCMCPKDMSSMLASVMVAQRLVKCCRRSVRFVEKQSRLADNQVPGWTSPQDYHFTHDDEQALQEFLTNRVNEKAIMIFDCLREALEKLRDSSAHFIDAVRFANPPSVIETDVVEYGRASASFRSLLASLGRCEATVAVLFSRCGGKAPSSF